MSIRSPLGHQSEGLATRKYAFALVYFQYF